MALWDSLQDSQLEHSCSERHHTYQWHLWTAKKTTADHFPCNILNVLLDQLEIVLAIDDHQLLIPSALPVKRPEDLGNESKGPFYSRLIFFSSGGTPPGLWNCLLCRIMHSILPQVCFTQHGECVKQTAQEYMTSRTPSPTETNSCHYSNDVESTSGQKPPNKSFSAEDDFKFTVPLSAHNLRQLCPHQSDTQYHSQVWHSHSNAPHMSMSHCLSLLCCHNQSEKWSCNRSLYMNMSLYCCQCTCLLNL